MKLSIGSGRNTAALQANGWTTLDADPAAKPDILASVPPLPDVVMGQNWDCIEMIHVIEHFYLRDATKLLTQCYEILSDDGLLIMEMPNIEYAAKALLGMVPARQQPRLFHDMYAFYGDQTTNNPLYQHLWGYTPQTMSELLASIGFSKVRPMPATQHWPWRDFRIEAMR